MSPTSGWLIDRRGYSTDPRGVDMSYEESSALAHLSQEQACRTEDHKEEVEAFLEKRRPLSSGGRCAPPLLSIGNDCTVSPIVPPTELMRARF